MVLQKKSYLDPNNPAVLAWRRRHLPGNPSKIECDKAVRIFVDRHLPAMTFQQLALACRERFGADRAPSKSSMHLYWQRRRRGHLQRQRKMRSRLRAARQQPRLPRG
jgi:hypothetical protein